MLQPKPIQKQIQPQKHKVHLEVHAPMEPPVPEVPIESQIPDEALDQVRYPSAPKDPSQEGTYILEPQWLPIAHPQPTPLGFRINITSRFAHA